LDSLLNDVSNPSTGRYELGTSPLSPIFSSPLILIAGADAALFFVLKGRKKKRGEAESKLWEEE
jgi:hypothetical protein